MSVKLYHLEKLLLLAFEPNDILDKFQGFCLTPDGNKIRSTPSLDREGRVKKFVELLNKKGETEGNIYQEFVDNLKTVDQYAWLLPLLTDDDPYCNLLCALESVEKIPQVVNVFRLIYPAFEDIDVNDVILNLKSHLTNEDEQEVKACTDSRGNSHGFYVLINKLLIKEPSWVEDLIKSIEQKNYNATCRMFEDGEYEYLADALRTFFDFLPKHEELKQKKLAVTSASTSQTNYLEHTEQANEKAALQSVKNDQSVDKLGDPIVSGEQEDFYGINQNASPRHLNQRPPASQEGYASQALQLYGYQEELCEKALSGKSVIICAPTGSGKTFVAAKIIEKHLSLNESAKVLFFTPTGGLANQQYEKLREYLPAISSKIEELIGGSAGEDFGIDIRSKIYSNTIIVMTPQILINALKPKTSDCPESPIVQSIFDFSMMIFDECHHAYKSHPYNQILVKYLQAKREQKKSIQIIGLSATLGIGKAKCQDTAVQHIISLCGSLDAMDGVVTVRKPENVDELESKCPGNNEVMLPVSKDDSNIFKNEVREAINQVIDMLKEIGAFSIPGIELPKENARRDIDMFRQWCIGVRKDSCQYNDKENRNTLGRDTATCSETLEALNNAIEIYNNCRPTDAIAELETFTDEKFVQSEEKNTKIEMRLHSMMNEMLQKLKEYSTRPECRNKNLDTIEREILGKVGQDPDSRIILMVPKRMYTRYLKEWMNDTPSLQHLKAEIFTGVSNSSSNVPGITRNEQENTMKMFNEGEIKAIIATPDAAGEGMDVQGCNLVINYDYMRNEISKLQTIGRARKEDSRVIHISSYKVQSQDKLTLLKIHLMRKATAQVEKLQRRKPESYRKLLEASQVTTINLEILAERKRNAQPEQDPHRIFQVLCRKCSRFICESSDIIRLEEIHHTVHHKDIKSKYYLEDHPKKGSSCGNTDMRKMSKIFCNECKHDWGVVVSWKTYLVPLLAIAGIKFMRGSEKMPMVSKWKKAPFRPRDCNPESDASLMYTQYFDLDFNC